jgi:hypothetical protein
MTLRTRDTLLLIAGLPGIAAIFLPVTGYFPRTTPGSFLLSCYTDILHPDLPDGFLWITLPVLPVLLPIAVATLQLYRLLQGPRANHAVIAALAVTALLTVACFAWSALALRDGAIPAPQ